MSQKGLIRVYTGDGKGKTTAALATALQFLSRGQKVYMVQFIKRPDTSGEHFAAKILGPSLIMKPIGTRGFIRKRTPLPEERREAQLALDESREAMLSGEYQLVILDEANVAVHKEVIEVQEILNFMKAKPSDVELVLTGRNAHAQVIAQADQVLEMKKIKHHFDAGIPAIEGVDY